MNGLYIIHIYIYPYYIYIHIHIIHYNIWIMNDTFLIYTCSCPPPNFPHFLPFIPNDQVINTLIQNPSRSVITSQHIISLA